MTEFKVGDIVMHHTNSEVVLILEKFKDAFYTIFIIWERDAKAVISKIYTNQQIPKQYWRKLN